LCSCRIRGHRGAYVRAGAAAWSSGISKDTRQCLEAALYERLSARNRCSAAIDLGIHCAQATPELKGVALPVGLPLVSLTWLARMPELSEAARDGTRLLGELELQRAVEVLISVTDSDASRAGECARRIFEDTKAWIRSLDATLEGPSSSSA